MSGLSEEQILYLRDVLGIDGIVLGQGITPPLASSPAAASPGAPSPARITGDIGTARLLVVATGSEGFPLDGDAGDLATKMIQAMKLASIDVLTVEWFSGVPDESVLSIWANWKGLVLSFGARAAQQLSNHQTTSGQWLEVESKRVMVTESPRDLLVDPSKKKTAWSHLQQLMKELAL